MTIWMHSLMITLQMVCNFYGIYLCSVNPNLVKSKEKSKKHTSNNSTNIDAHQPEALERPSTRQGASRSHHRREPTDQLDEKSSSSRPRRPDDTRLKKERKSEQNVPSSMLQIDEIEEDIQPIYQEVVKSEKKSKKSHSSKINDDRKIIAIDDIEEAIIPLSEEQLKTHEQHHPATKSSSSRKPKHEHKTSSTSPKMNDPKSAKSEVVVNAFALTNSVSASLAFGDIGELVRLMKAENDLALTSNVDSKIDDNPPSARNLNSLPEPVRAELPSSPQPPVHPVPMTGVRTTARMPQQSVLGMFVFNSNSSQGAQSEIKRRAAAERLASIKSTVLPSFAMDPPRRSATLFDQQPMNEQQKLLNSVGKYSNKRSVICETEPPQKANVACFVTQAKIQQELISEDGLTHSAVQVPCLLMDAQKSFSSQESSMQPLESFLSRTENLMHELLREQSLRVKLREVISSSGKGMDLVSALGESDEKTRKDLLRRAQGDLFAGRQVSDVPALMCGVAAIPKNVRWTVHIGSAANCVDDRGDRFEKLKTEFRVAAVTLDSVGLNPKIIIWFSVETVPTPVGATNSDIPQQLPSAEKIHKFATTLGGVRTLGYVLNVDNFGSIGNSFDDFERPTELLKSSSVVTCATSDIAGWSGAVVMGSGHGSLIAFVRPLIGQLESNDTCQSIELIDGTMAIIREAVTTTDEVNSLSSYLSAINSRGNAETSLGSKLRDADENNDAAPQELRSSSSVHKGPIVDVRPLKGVVGRFISLDASGLVCRWELSLGNTASNSICIRLLNAYEPSIISPVLIRPLPTLHNSAEHCLKAWGGFAISNSKPERANNKLRFLSARKLAPVPIQRADLTLIATDFGVGLAGSDPCRSLSSIPLVTLPRKEAVTAISVSPFSPNLFLVASYFGDLYLFDVDRIEPIAHWERAVWSPLIAAGNPYILGTHTPSSDMALNHSTFFGSSSMNQNNNNNNNNNENSWTPSLLLSHSDAAISDINSQIVSWSRTRPCVFYTIGGALASSAASKGIFGAPISSANDRILVWDLSCLMSKNIMKGLKDPALILDSSKLIGPSMRANTAMMEATWYVPKGAAATTAPPVFELADEFLVVNTRGCPIALALHQDLTTPLTKVPTPIANLPKAHGRFTESIRGANNANLENEILNFVAINLLPSVVGVSVENVETSFTSSFEMLSTSKKNTENKQNLVSALNEELVVGTPLNDSSQSYRSKEKQLGNDYSINYPTANNPGSEFSNAELNNSSHTAAN